MKKAKSLEEMRKKADDMPNPEPASLVDEPAAYTDEEIRKCFETLLKADDIKKKPELMKLIAAHAEGKKETVHSLADLKDKYDKVLKEESEPKLKPAKEKKLG